MKIDIFVEIVVFIMNLDKHSNREFVAILLALLVFFMLLQLKVVYFRFWSMPMIKCFFTSVENLLLYRCEFVVSFEIQKLLLQSRGLSYLFLPPVLYQVSMAQPRKDKKL